MIFGKQFPCYMQVNRQDSGFACIQIVAGYYGKKYSQSLIKNSVTHKSDDLSDVMTAATQIGFNTEKRLYTLEQLKGVVNLPCILNTCQNQFVVLYKISRAKDGTVKYYISDPSFGFVSYYDDGLGKKWIKEGEDAGCLITLTIGDKFNNINFQEKARLTLYDYLPFFLPYKKYIIQIIAIILVGSLISLIFPFLTQAVVDVGINKKEISIVFVIFIAQLMLMLGQLASGFIKNHLTLHTMTRISISLTSSFLDKLMRLPMAFFDKRNIGDITTLISDNTRIQSFITNTLINIFIAAITFVTYFLVLLNYNIHVLWVFIVGSIIYIFWTRLFLKKRRELDYRRFYETSTNQNNIVQLLMGMQDIKLYNREKNYRWEWERTQTNLYKITIDDAIVDQGQQLGGFLINQSKNILISLIAAIAVINNEMTLGMMMAMQYVIGQLNVPISQLLTFIKSSQDTKISLERIGEIINREDEEPEGVNKVKEIPTEKIRMENVSFKYESCNKMVLEDIKIAFPVGKTTAIVGNSGCGKTTILKLLLGYYNPSGGNIYLGDQNLSSYSDSCWRNKCGVVMQDCFIFSDTILKNIVMGEECPNMDSFTKAIKLANIDEYIHSLPLNYNTKIGMDGNGLSSGQRQRILIARMIYKDPQYIFLDEATNALDVNTEHSILENIKCLFERRTIIVVAHRLSTIRGADNIIVLNQGRITEEGNHEQLIERKGVYHKLVQKQLGENENSKK